MEKFALPRTLLGHGDEGNWVLLTEKQPTKGAGYGAFKALDEKEGTNPCIGLETRTVRLTKESRDAFPTGKGSTVGSYTILRLARSGHGPAAIVNAESEAIVAVGAIIADIPMVDQVDIGLIRDGDWVVVEDGTVTIRR